MMHEKAFDGNTKPHVMAEDEHQRMVVEFNCTSTDYPSDRSIVNLFSKQVEATPDREAIRFGDQSLTYCELDQRANQISWLLRGLGVQTGDPVVVYMEHSLEVVCAIWGVLKAAAAYVPIDSGTPKDRLIFMLDDVSKGLNGRMPVLITQNQLSSKLPQGIARIVHIEPEFSALEGFTKETPAIEEITTDLLAYIIYTSGSTGVPKGVMIGHQSLVNYVWWANEQYCQGESLTWPLFSSLAFDLTVTSIFTPLISGGRIVVYREDSGGHSMVIFKVIQDGTADIIKLTPAHLAMVRDLDLGASNIRRMIVGGEDFKADLAREISERFGRSIEIYNEYGPTEATVGCMIHKYVKEKDTGHSVPIGRPAANARVYVLDEKLQPVPVGVIGEMYLAGDGLARGYFNRPELTSSAFVVAHDPRDRVSGIIFNPVEPTELLYKTGDMARWNSFERLDFLGRSDHQVKIGGFRIELGEIEACLLNHPKIRESAVEVKRSGGGGFRTPTFFCSRCGLASNYPDTKYDEEGVCNLCRAYDTYAEKAKAYFCTREDFLEVVEEMKANRTGEYDCLVLFSGGKDSTYMLFQLCDLGLKPLVFSLDNGFISEGAKTNIQKTIKLLEVDLIFGTTPHMNEIFVDSLNHFSNVCNGCFKTIYTLATNLAHEKSIRYIVTGLSRGQFFETRLTEEVFRQGDFDPAKIDEMVLEARKAYHQREDAVSCHLAVDVIRGEGVLDDIQFVDFYRYWSVPLEELYNYLHKHSSWQRPADTGRSTNCMINELGIYLHKKQRGFHNYSLPYSWDVRLGQKTRLEAMDELEDDVDEARVRQLMNQIGYVEPDNYAKNDIECLVAYYTSDAPLMSSELRSHLATQLPAYMLPTHYVHLPTLPLSSNGKVDRNALPYPSGDSLLEERLVRKPITETEKRLASIWEELLSVGNIGLDDEFFELGGHSLLAIRAVSRIRELFGINLSLANMFANPTISGLAGALEEEKARMSKQINPIAGLAATIQKIDRNSRKEQK